ncbi:N-acetyltransferase family protein [Humidisolicoccus flavus]|uniref:GNAT family N-acetyltransferase n=1 Tax=Humidisolicoccus flavus TaxID=3111414 RepID=UPI00324B9CAA
MEFSLRQSTRDDLPWLLELRAEVLRDDLERLGRYDPVRVRQWMSDVFDPALTQIIEIDGESLGSITVRLDNGVRWIEHFYLPPSMQGRGIGTRVLDAVLRKLLVSPLPVRLNVLQGSAARRLYERVGFVVDTEDEVNTFMTLRRS